MEQHIIEKRVILSSKAAGHILKGPRAVRWVVDDNFLI